MKTEISSRNLVILVLMLMGIGTRLIGHYIPNFTAVGAIALFAGAKFSDKRAAFLLSMGIMLVSDLFIGFHNTMWAVYGAFAFTVFLGILIQGKKGVLPIAGASLLSSLVFFLLTNFAAWYGSTLYPQNIAGLLESYIAALPFLRNEAAADILFNGIFFGGFYLAETRFPVLAKR